MTTMENLVDVTIQFLPELTAVLSDFSVPILAKSLVPSAKRPEIVFSNFGKRNTENGVIYVLRIAHKVIHLAEKKGDVTHEMRYELTGNRLVLNGQEMGNLVKRHVAERIQSILLDVIASKAGIYAKTPLLGTTLGVEVRKRKGTPKLIKKKGVSDELESEQYFAGETQQHR